MSFGYTVKAQNPATLPAGSALAIAFSPDGAYVAVAHSSPPGISVYPWNGVQFGPKFTDPATLPVGNGTGVAWSPDGAYIAVTHASSPFVSVYPWSGAGFGTKVANPGVAVAGFGLDVKWSPDGLFIAVAHATAPRISVYPWSAGFGTKVANPGTAIPGTARGVAFSPDGAFIGIACETTPFIIVHPWTGTFGTKVANPASLPGASGFGIAWSPDGAYVGVAQIDSGVASIYPWTGTFGTKVSAPGTPIPGTFGNSLAWSADGAHIAFANGNTTGATICSVYEWSAGYGAKVADPAGTPTAVSGTFTVGEGIAFSPAGSVAAAWGFTAPFVAAFEDGDTVRVAIPAGVIILSGPAPTVLGVIGTIVQPVASFSAQETRPAVGSEAFPMAGAPTYPLTLFRGAVIGVSADRNNGLLHLVLDCEDYNRQPPLIDVGVPLPGLSIVDPQGVEIDIDPNALNFGIGAGDGGVVKHFVSAYWPIALWVPVPNLSDVQNTNPDYDGLPIFDRQTAYGTFASIVGEFIRQRGSGASRFWVTPRGTDLMAQYRVVGLFDGLPDQRVAAPWALSTEGKAGTIMANIRTTWDKHAIRRRVLVVGGTPNAILYRTNPLAPTNAGDGRVDAKGVTTRAEAERVGDFHLRANLREMLIADVYVPPGHFEGGVYVPNDGFEEGQSTLLSDEKMVGLVDHELDDREAIVQEVNWGLADSNAGIEIVIDALELTDLIVGWEDLSGERRLGGVGKATIALWLWDPDYRITIRDLADVLIRTDGNAHIEYNLRVGDVPAGDLAIQFRDNTRPPFTRPVYTFNVFVTDPEMPPGGSSPVIITPALAGFEPRDLAGFTLIPLLDGFSWADAGETIPSDEFTLDDDGTPVVTNAVGQVYTTLRRALTTATGTDHWQIKCVAVPKVEP